MSTSDWLAAVSGWATGGDEADGVLAVGATAFVDSSTTAKLPPMSVDWLSKTPENDEDSACVAVGMPESLPAGPSWVAVLDRGPAVLKSRDSELAAAERLSVGATVPAGRSVGGL